MHLPLNSKRINIQTGLVSLALLLTVGIGVGGYVSTQRITNAAPVPESCFTMDGGDPGMILDYNAALNAACLSDVTIPSTVGGNTVTGIGSGAFNDDVITAVTFPNTITEIQSAAFSHAGITLSSVTLNVTGNLTIGSGAFGDNVSGNVTIQAAGDIEYGESFQNATLGTLSFNSGGTFTIPDSSPSTTGSISNLLITAGDDIAIGAGSFDGRVITSATIESDADILINGGSFNTEIGDITVDAALSLTISESSFDLWPGLTLGSIDFSAGTSLSIDNSINDIASLGSLRLESGTGLMSLSSNAVCNIDDIASATFIAPSGLSILSGSLCDLPDLEVLNLDGVAGNVIVDNSIQLTGITSFNLNTDGTVMLNYAFESSNADLASVDVHGSTVQILNSFSNPPALESVSLIAENNLTVNFSVSGSSVLSDLVLEAGGSTTISGAFTGSSQLTVASISGTGDIIITSSSFTGVAALTGISIETNGLITIENSSFNGMNALATAEFNAGGAVYIGNGAFSNAPALTDLSIISGGAVTLTNGGLQTTPVLANVSITGAGALLINNGAFTAAPLLETLSIDGTTGVTIAGSTFSNNLLEEVTFPSVPVTIGANSFAGTQLNNVTFGSVTPTIGSGVFQLTGASYSGGIYTNLNQVRYTPIYIETPGALVNTVWPAADVNGDTVNDRTGGYLINPAQFSVEYRSPSNVLLGSEEAIVGRQLDETPILTYLLSENPTDDFSLYYFVSDSLSFDAPDFASYITPDSQTIALDAGPNTVTFAYTSPAAPVVPGEPVVDPSTPGAPNTGLEVLASIARTVGSNNSTLLATILAVTGFSAIIAGIVMYRRSEK